MYIVYIKGAELTNSKLNNILKHIQPYEYRVVMNYRHLIPKELLDDKDNAVRFVICLIPQVGNFPAGMIAAQLMKGPAYNVVDTVPEDQWVCTVVKDLIANHYDKVKDSITEMRKHKHIPEKYLNRDDLILTVIVQEMCNRYLLVELTVDSILNNIEDYYNKVF